MARIQLEINQPQVVDYDVEDGGSGVIILSSVGIKT